MQKVPPKEFDNYSILKNSYSVLQLNTSHLKSEKF